MATADVSTQLSFVRRGNAGELVGQPNQGLTYMFHMMNGRASAWDWVR